MTIDLSRIPKKEGISEVIVFTSDTDFVPIIKDLSEDGINVILAYFTYREKNLGFLFQIIYGKLVKIKLRSGKNVLLNNRNPHEEIKGKIELRKIPYVKRNILITFSGTLSHP